MPLLFFNQLEHEPDLRDEPSSPMASNQSPEVITVTLKKRNDSLGISIVGATARGEQEPGIYIKIVRDDGAAALDGRLERGDQILEIDGHSLVGVSWELAAELLKNSGKEVELCIAKLAAYFHNVENVLSPPSAPSLSDTDITGELLAPIASNQSPEVITVTLKKRNNSLGISIVVAIAGGQQGSGVYIKIVRDGGAAALDGRLERGDQILEMDGKSLVGVSWELAAEYLKTSGQEVELCVAKLAADLDNLETMLRPPALPSQTDLCVDSVNLNALDVGDDVLSPIASNHGRDVITVTLKKRNDSLGISIVGAIARGQQEPGIYIKTIRDGGAAALDGRLDRGDQILEIDGHSLVGVSWGLAAELLRNSGQEVELCIAKLAAYFHNVENVLSPPSAPSLSDTDITGEFLSPIASNQSPEVITVTLKKRNDSLGISIVGAIARGQQEPGIYIKIVRDGGPAALDGRLERGDQILEIDGHSLVGVSWELAADMLKSSGQEVRLRVGKLTAYLHNLETMLRPPTLETGNLYGPERRDELLSQIASNQSPEVITVTLKKRNDSLGISIVGATARGQQEPGIYIKAVRDGGAAALDGRLERGDQILEIDGHSLVGVSWELAAECLKNTGQDVHLLVAKLAAHMRPSSPPNQTDSDFNSYHGQHSNDEDLPSYHMLFPTDHSGYGQHSDDEVPPPSYDSLFPPAFSYSSIIPSAPNFPDTDDGPINVYI